MTQLEIFFENGPEILHISTVNYFFTALYHASIEIINEANLKIRKIQQENSEIKKELSFTQNLLKERLLQFKY